jgi:hypothetical protein
VISSGTNVFTTTPKIDSLILPNRLILASKGFCDGLKYVKLWSSAPALASVLEYNISNPDNQINIEYFDELKQEGDFLIGGEGTLVSYSGSGGDVTIPEGVTAIADRVFAPVSTNATTWGLFDAKADKSNYLTNVVFPSTLTKIGNYAFYGQEKLAGMTLPNSLEEIGANAFNGLKALKGGLTIPENVTTVGANAFNGCAFDGALIINARDITFGTAVFASSATTVVNFTSIGCAEGASVKTGTNCFGKASAKLTSINLPASYLEITAPAFSGATGLQSAYITGIKVIPNTMFSGCTNASFTSFVLPDGVTTIGGTSTTTSSVTFYNTKFTELIFPASLTTTAGYVTYRSSIANVAVLADEFASYSANTFKPYSTNAPPTVYAYPDTAAYEKLASDTSIKTLKTLTRDAIVTAQGDDGELLYANEALTLAWDDYSGGYGSTENITPSFEPTVLDAAAAAAKAQPTLAELFGGSHEDMAFVLNGVKYSFAEAGSKPVNNGDRLHFFRETDTTFAWIEYNNSPVGELSFAPGLNYSVTLKSGDGDPLANVPVYIARIGDDVRTWEPVNGEGVSVTDSDGKISLSFGISGSYYITPYDPSNGVVYNFLPVTVYAPDNGLVLGTVTGEFDTSTLLGAGFRAGTLVRTEDGEPLGVGFDTEHREYEIYVNLATADITIPISLHSLAYLDSLTLTAELDGGALSGFDNVKASETGGFGSLTVVLPDDGTESVLTLTASCVENGETFSRVYTIKIIRAENQTFSGITDMVGLGTADSAMGTALVEPFVNGASSYKTYIHAGQEKAVYAVTVLKGTDVYVGDAPGGAKQTAVIPSSDADTVTYRVELDCSVHTTAHTITTYRNDTFGERTATYNITFTRRSSVNGVHTPDKAVEYKPATGQFVAPGAFDHVVFASQSMASARTSYGKYVTLGEHGGYLTVYYEMPITDDPYSPYGIDFIIYGNAFEGGAASEPASVQVSYDGETWYYLAGQRHYELATRYEDSVPLYDGSTVGSQLLLRAGDEGFSGGYPPYVTWGYADVASASEIKNAEGAWEVNARPYNPYRAGSMGHYDNGGNIGDMFDLAWAVDSGGKPLDLNAALPDGIRYIKMQNVTDVKKNSTFGEVSPEIGTITRVNPAYTKSEPIGTTAEPSALTINGMSFDDFTGKVETNGGRTTYYELDLKKLGSTVDVHVEGAERDNIFVNMLPYYGGTAEYSGLLDSDGSRTVRVVVQNGEQEPRIYVINCTNGGDPAKNADLFSIRLTPGDVTLAKDDSGSYICTVANAATAIKLAVTSLNPAATITIDGTETPSGKTSEQLPVAVGENNFDITVTSTDGTVSETYSVAITRSDAPSNPGTPQPNTITVWFEFTGDDIHYDFIGSDRKAEDSYVKIGEHNPKTWIARQQVTVPAGSTVKYVTDMLLMNEHIEFSSRDMGTYIDWAKIPANSGNAPVGGKLEEFSNGPNSGWMYRYNGLIANEGYASRVLKDGASVLWFYTDDYQLEKGYEDDSGWGFDTSPNSSASGGDAEETVTDEATQLAAFRGGDIVATETAAAETKTENGKATATVTTETVTDAITKANEAITAAKENGATHAQAEIKIVAKTDNATEPISSSEVNIPAAAIKAVAGAQDLILTVETDVSTITLDTATLTAIAETAKDGDTVKIAAEVGEDSAIELNITVGDTAIAAFAGTVMVSLPYTPEATTAPEDYDLLTVYHLADDGKTTEIKGAQYDAATKQMIFSTTHFSKFLISEWISPFTDIAKGEWFYKAARYAYSNALITGTTDTTFAPQSTLTRAMLITILARDAGVDTSGGDTWYSKAVDWGMSNGLTDGTNMNNPITREQFATLLFRYAKLQGKNTSEASDYSTYTDAASVSDWAREAMAWAYATDLVTGRTETTLAPLGTANRAEAATLLQRYLENIG